MKKILFLAASLLNSVFTFGQSTSVELQGITKFSENLPTSYRSTVWSSSYFHDKQRGSNNGTAVFALATISPISKNGVYSGEVVIGRYYHSSPEVKSSLYHEYGWYIGLEHLSTANVQVGPRVSGYYTGYYSPTGNMYPRKDWFFFTEYGPLTSYWYLGQLMWNKTAKFGVGIHAQAYQCIGPRVQFGNKIKVSFNAGYNLEAKQFGGFTGLRYTAKH